MATVRGRRHKKLFGKFKRVVGMVFDVVVVKNLLFEIVSDNLAILI